MEQPYVLNPLDILIIAVIIFGMYVGSKNGLFKVSTRIVSILVSIIVGMRFRLIFENVLLDYFSLNLSNEGLIFWSFAIGFVLTFIIVSTFLRSLTSTLKRINIGIDSALGAIFGGSLATLSLSVILYALSFAGFPSEANARGSLTYPFVKSFARYTLGLIPKALRAANRTVQKYGGEVLPPDQETLPISPQDEEDGQMDNNVQKPRAIR